ncbi:MAG TPA: hypothetical protein DCP92_15475 [Nitrospiraceae bacterium]|nr:hypothetical protein [Nitrospiraceae bacterium]
MTLSELEKQKEGLLRKMEALGDMRSGSISVRFQKCGKRPCVCHSPGHIGHGPIYSYSALVSGKTQIRNYKPGPELEKLRKETENYQLFKELSQELIEISNKICDLRPLSPLQDDELEELKKKLKRHFMKKYKKRLTGS